MTTYDDVDIIDDYDSPITASDDFRDTDLSTPANTMWKPDNPLFVRPTAPNGITFNTFDVPSTQPMRIVNAAPNGLASRVIIQGFSNTTRVFVFIDDNIGNKLTDGVPTSYFASGFPVTLAAPLVLTTNKEIWALAIDNAATNLVSVAVEQYRD